MAYEHILLDRDEHVAIVTLNRPEKFNALNPVLWEEIIQIGEDLRADDSVRAVVFTGAGRGFCSGAEQGRAPTEGAVPTRDEFLDEYRRIGRQALSIYKR